MQKITTLLVAVALVCNACSTPAIEIGNDSPAEEAAAAAEGLVEVTEEITALAEHETTEESEPTVLVAEVDDHLVITDDEWEMDQSMMHTGREFMIILSSKDFEKSMEYAVEAAEKLQLELRIDDLEEVDGHLSYSPTICDESGFDHPCYVARGRYDDGDYVSVEQSDAYDGFTRGYFIVVVSSGPKSDPDRRDLLVDVKAHYESAYVKSTQVYMGCMH